MADKVNGGLIFEAGGLSNEHDMRIERPESQNNPLCIPVLFILWVTDLLYYNVGRRQPNACGLGLIHKFVL